MLEERLSFDKQYRNLGLIGSGGQGQVFKVEERATGRRYAAKRFILDDWEELQRLEDEVKALQRLQHPNLVAYQNHSALEENWSPELFLVTEYVEGKSLAQYLAAGKRFSEEEITGIKSQLVAGLTYAHSQSIVHRDIKPENILLRDDGLVKITDFGVSKVLGERTRTSSIGKGTFSYMAPEQLLGGKITEATDYHGLGLLLVALASGKERTDDIRFQKPADDIARLRSAGRYSTAFLDSLELLVDENPEKRKEGLRIKEDIGETVGGGEKDEVMEEVKKYLGGDKLFEQQLSYFLSFSGGTIGGIVGVGNHIDGIPRLVMGTMFFGGPLLMFTYRNALRPLGLKVGRGMKRLFSRRWRKAEEETGIRTFTQYDPQLGNCGAEDFKVFVIDGLDYIVSFGEAYQIRGYNARKKKAQTIKLPPKALTEFSVDSQEYIFTSGKVYRIIASDTGRKKAQTMKVSPEATTKILQEYLGDEYNGHPPENLWAVPTQYSLEWERRIDKITQSLNTLKKNEPLIPSLPNAIKRESATPGKDRETIPDHPSVSPHWPEEDIEVLGFEELERQAKEPEISFSEEEIR